MRTVVVFADSRFPASSIEKYRTVVVASTVNGPLYTWALEDVAGSLPSVVYVVAVTPEPVSVAVSAISRAV
jgi:hypothetical protein